MMKQEPLCRSLVWFPDLSVCPRGRGGVSTMTRSPFPLSRGLRHGLKGRGSLQGMKGNPQKAPSSRSDDLPRKKKVGRKGKRHFKVDIYRAWCKACGICEAFCPVQVFDREEDGQPRVARPDQCTGCRWCEIHCPDFAITVEENGEEEHKEAESPSRNREARRGGGKGSPEERGGFPPGE